MPVHLWWRIVLANLDERGRQVISSALGGPRPLRLDARRRSVGAKDRLREEKAGCESKSATNGPTAAPPVLLERDTVAERSPALLAYLELTLHDRELIQHHCQATDSDLLEVLQRTKHLDDFEAIRELSRNLREIDYKGREQAQKRENRTMQ